MIKSGTQEENLDLPPRLNYSLTIEADIPSRRLLVQCPELGIEQDCILQKTTVNQVLSTVVRQVGEQIKGVL